MAGEQSFSGCAVAGELKLSHGDLDGEVKLSHGDLVGELISFFILVLGLFWVQKFFRFVLGAEIVTYIYTIIVCVHAYFSYVTQPIKI